MLSAIGSFLESVYNDLVSPQEDRVSALVAEVQKELDEQKRLTAKLSLQEDKLKLRLTMLQEEQNKQAQLIAQITAAVVSQEKPADQSTARTENGKD